MDDPIRLLDEDVGSDERELLEAGRREEPPVGAHGRALVALGVGSGFIGTAGTAAAGTAAKSASASAGVGAGAAGASAVGAGAAGATVGGASSVGTTVTTIAIAKWFGAGLLGGTLALGTAAGVGEMVSTDSQPAESEPSAEASGAAVAPVDTSESVIEPRGDPQAPDPVAEADEQIVAPEGSADAPSIADEVALLDDARAAIGRGDVAGARAALTEHARRFPRGSLHPEAAVLRIEVALNAGSRAEAAALARDFLRTHEGSPHASKVRTLLERATRGNTAPSHAAEPVLNRPSAHVGSTAATRTSAEPTTGAPERGESEPAAASGSVGSLPPIE